MRPSVPGHLIRQSDGAGREVHERGAEERKNRDDEQEQECEVPTEPVHAQRGAPTGGLRFMSQRRHAHMTPDGYLPPESVNRGSARQAQDILSVLRVITKWFDRWAWARLDGWFIIPVLAVAALFGVGVMLKYNVYMTSTDLRFVQAVGRHHDGLATGVALAIHAGLGGPFAVVVLALVAGLVLWLKRSAADAWLVILLATGGWALTLGMKIAVGRPRPEPSSLTDVLVTGLNGFTSFPSGHTAFAVSLAIAVTLAAWSTRWRALILVSSALFSVAVAASRVYLGVHYPTDVCASFILSSAAAVLIAGLVTRCGPGLSTRIRDRRARHLAGRHVEGGRR